MKRTLIVWVMLGALSAQAGMSKLAAISMLETGDNDRAVGKAGERSRYQLMPSTWRMYTTQKDYTNPVLAAKIAARHLEALETNFRAKTHREPTDFDRYVLWNAGENYYARVNHDPGRVHRVIRERAERYVNLRQMPDREPMLAMGGMH